MNHSFYQFKPKPPVNKYYYLRGETIEEIKASQDHSIKLPKISLEA
jgi:hypothetical protein